MRRSLTLGAALVLLAASTVPGLAATCRDRFVQLLVEGNGDQPVKIHVTQEIKGAPTTTNWFYRASADHWMTETIEPAGQPSVVAYNNVMYTSADGGKTWTKLRELGGTEDAKTALAENAKTARNEVCGEEELDGVVREVVEADYDTLQNFKTENHFKYWVDRESGFIVKAVYAMKGKGFESLSTQIIEPAPDLNLPTPEDG